MLLLLLLLLQAWLQCGATTGLSSFTFKQGTSENATYRPSENSERCSRSWLFKIIQSGTNRKPVCYVLLVTNKPYLPPFLRCCDEKVENQRSFAGFTPQSRVKLPHRVFPVTQPIYTIWCQKQRATRLWQLHDRMFNLWLRVTDNQTDTPFTANMRSE